MKKNIDIQFLDAIDLFCQFSDKLELAKDENNNYINTPSLDFMSRRMDFLDEEVEELRKGIEDKDLVETLDGALDVAFIAITQAYHLFRKEGHNHTKAVVSTRTAMYEVGIANLLKNKPTKKGEKITKPEGWKSPNTRLKWLITPPANDVELKQYREELGTECA